MPSNPSQAEIVPQGRNPQGRGKLEFVPMQASGGEAPTPGQEDFKIEAADLLVAWLAIAQRFEDGDNVHVTWHPGADACPEALRLSENTSFAELRANLQLRSPYDEVLIGSPSHEARRQLPNLLFIREALSRFRQDAHADNPDYGLVFHVMEGADGALRAALYYDTTALSEETAEKYLHYIRNILADVLEDKSRSLRAVCFVEEGERTKALLDWNTTAIAYPKQDFHEIFEKHASSSPDSVAVSFGNESLTYCELNKRANRLAQYLKNLGASEGKVVGIAVERSFDMLVAMLAILKSGAAYLPLDASYPIERLHAIVADSAPELILVHQSTTDIIRDCAADCEHQPVLINMDRDVANWAELPSSNVESASGDWNEQLAYVIYTSGSTGKPKGVMVKRGGLTNLLFGMRDLLKVTSADVFLGITSLAFDIAGLELLLPLLVGGSVAITTRAIAHDGAALAKLIETGGVSTIQATPATWRILLAAGWLPQSNLRMLCGGEALPPDLAEKLTLGGGELWNLYGPTETTIWSTAAKIQSVSAGDTVTIGRPIANTSIYILDKHGNPVPVGCSGELYIGGYGVARGYFNNPALTEERFIEDRFSGSGKLYKTGDVARYLPDGNIQYLGRNDFQVKIRGFRVELGEIESCLQKYSAIDQAVVVVHEGANGNKQLVAHYSAKPGCEIDRSSVRDHVAAMLPEYMIPSAYVPLSQMPLTPNGKIDRKALPAPGPSDHLQKSYIPPDTLYEAIAARLWQEELGLEKIGATDNFFMLGGTSLSATRVVPRMSAEIGRVVPLQFIFENPILKEFCARLETLPSSAIVEYPALSETGRPDAVPASSSQERLWFFDQFSVKKSLYNLAVSLQITGNLNIEILSKSITSLVRRHETLRTIYQDIDGKLTQRVLADDVVPLEIFDLSGLSRIQREKCRKQLVTEAESRPIDLTHGPLFYASLVKCAKTDHTLTLTTHHIGSDGWSTGVLLRDLGRIYSSLLTGEPLDLPELPFQYLDYAVGQRQHQSALGSTQIAYWQKQLQGAPSSIALPLDHLRPPLPRYEGKQYCFKWSPEFQKQILAFAQAQESTLYMVLLAAFQILLSRWSGQTDLVIGSPIAGRTLKDSENLVGFFVNMLVMRGQVRSQETFLDHLHKVRQTAIEGYANQDVAFERIVAELRPNRDVSRHPIFQVVLALQNVPAFRCEIPSCTTTVLDPAGNKTAKFDITLALTETQDGLHGIAEYSTDIFEGATIERLVGEFRALLDKLIASPKAALNELFAFDGEAVRAAENIVALRPPKLVGNVMPDAVFVKDLNLAITSGRAVILDQSGGEVPHGAVGEICISSAGRPQAEPADRGGWSTSNDNSRDADKSLVRTGHNARTLSNGDLLYLGPTGLAPKATGLSTELAFVENLLRGYPGIGHAAIVSRDDMPEWRSTVYYMEEIGHSVDESALADHVSKSLPEYLWPRAYIRLKSWPLDGKGCLDVPRLSETESPSNELLLADNGTKLQDHVARIWQSFLKVETVAPSDDFFLIGGHSLLAIRVIAQIKTELQVEVPLPTFFQKRKLSELAAYIAAAPKPKAMFSAVMEDGAV